MLAKKVDARQRFSGGSGSNNYLYRGFTEGLSNKLLLTEIMCKTER